MWDFVGWPGLCIKQIFFKSSVLSPGLGDVEDSAVPEIISWAPPSGGSQLSGL